MILKTNRWAAMVPALLLGTGLAQDNAPDNLLNIQFQEDVRVFTVMAAINQAGFDFERKDAEWSSVRKEVRAALADLEPSLKARIQSLFDQQSAAFRARDRHVPYTSLGLLLGEPPGFELRVKEDDMPGDTWRVHAFQTILAEFYTKARIEELWDRYRPSYTAELAGYLPILRAVVKEALDYFRVPSRVMLDRRIILIPDLLNAHDIVNARNLERTYYIVVGPTQDPANNRPQLQHEYLHSLVDPLVDKYGANLLRHQKMIQLAERQPRLRPDMNEQFTLVASESLIESIQLRISGAEGEELERALIDRVREGLILAPYFFRSLEKYEKNELLALPAYLELIVDGINEDEIRQDLQTIDARESEFLAARREAEAEIERKNQAVTDHNRRLGVLEEAGRLFQEDRLDEARTRLQELLQDDPDNGNAFFYMAQVALRQGQLDEADSWFERTAQTEVQGWVKARSLISRGRIAAARERFDQSRRFWEEVAALTGDLKGAQDEAKALLAKLPEKR